MSRKGGGATPGCHQRVKLLRLMSGLNLTQAAKLLGLKRPHYMALEEGTAPLDPLVIEAIAAVYDIPPDRVCNGPLPVPVSYAPMRTAKDELDELALFMRQANAALWRIRQAYDEPWGTFVKRFTVPPLFPPAYPYRRLYATHIPVSIWLDLPHEVYNPSRGVIVRLRMYSKKKTYRTLELKWEQSIVVPPCRLIVQTTGGEAWLYVRPKL